MPSLRIHAAQKSSAYGHLLEAHCFASEYQALISDEHLWRAVASYYYSDAPLLAENRPIALMMRPERCAAQDFKVDVCSARQFTVSIQQAFYRRLCPGS